MSLIIQENHCISSLGIGRAVALRLAELGCQKVIAVSRTKKHLQDLPTKVRW